MSQKLNKIVKYRGDRLFNGAVNISWYSSDESKAKAASESFVFHGPKYHGVGQGDVGVLHGHKLIDTASFASSVVHRCYGLEDQPFTLAIAGYGTGKSHLGLTLASLVGDPAGSVAQEIVSSIETADAEIGGDVRRLFQEAAQPCLAVALNGMRSFDLTAEITKQIIRTLKKDGYDPRSLENLRPRFGQAITLVQMASKTVVKELLAATEINSAEELIRELENQEEQTYAKVHAFFASRGMSIQALGGESVRDVIDLTVTEYCGRDKPYRSLLILFDEFGKYTEFATVKSQIAGSGALQDLFEAVQSNSGNACFVGFIQFELNAYVQRIAPEYKNEILRYVTRYQSADKRYLSINLETLIASLIEKSEESLLEERLGTAEALLETQQTIKRLAAWFPHAKNYRLWGDAEQFHSIVRKGCWPLSPYSTWLLFFLTAAGKHLQERSALALLGDVMQRFSDQDVADVAEWTLSPADLWTEDLYQELISSEESGQQGSIAHAYGAVIAKHGARFSPEQVHLLRAVVLASKLGLVVSDKNEASDALGELAGLSRDIADQEIRLLQEEFNVIEWDEAFKAFDILGDAVPRTQFLLFVRQRVAGSYDEAGKATLFASRAAEWCDLLGDQTSDFAEEHKITTIEWTYKAATSNLEFAPQHIKIAGDRWGSSFQLDEPRGTIIYTYIGPSQSVDNETAVLRKSLRDTAREAGHKVLPILVVGLHDVDGILGQSLAEYAVLEDISESDRAKFGNLVGAHLEKLSKVIRQQVDSMIKNRHYVTALGDDLEATRLSRVGTELFQKIYKNPIPFPFDGFSTARGNAADTCHMLTRELLRGKLDYDGVMAKPVKVKNRAITVLHESWGIFNKNGTVSRRPVDTIIRSITEKWDDALAKDQRIPLLEAIKGLCRPPYGANLASAGLFLGVFVAPRCEKLVVMKDGQQFDLAQWSQEDLFKGKFIDMALLSGVDLMHVGEASAEWDTLLDEWERCDSYLEQQACLNRACDLKERLPVPPMSVYREQRLSEKGGAALQALGQMQRAREDAIIKNEKGLAWQDVSLLSWGVADLKRLHDKMVEEKPLWTNEHIQEIDARYQNGRQAVILIFAEWLAKQAPTSAKPEDVGDFKHKMTRKVGESLRVIGLETELEQLLEQTQQQVKNVESVADARQLLRDVESWLASSSDAMRGGRIEEIRALRLSGRDFSNKLRGMAQRVSLVDVVEMQARLSEQLQKLKDSEDTVIKRASSLWNTTICSDIDVDETLAEVDSLVNAFENLPDDLGDLRSMRRALRLFRDCHQRLSDNNLTWDRFHKAAKELKKECAEIIAEGDVPWAPSEVISAFVNEVSETREQRSLSWVNSVKEEAALVSSMTAAEANSIHSQLSSPPTVFAEVHSAALADITQKVNLRLSELKVEWLVEQFKELPPQNRKEFMRIAEKLLGEKPSKKLTKS